jgi:ubiquinone/menaquinone biosynthesis C-methylase UbiE
MSSDSRSYARIADRYERLRGGDRRARQLGDALLPWTEPGWSVLDVGAGTGIVTARLDAAGRRMVALDISVEMLSQAARRLPGRVAIADAARLPVLSGSVDAVQFVWVLHHVGDLAAALAEARRVARPGGRVIAVSGVADPVDDDLDPIYRALQDDLEPQRQQHGAEVIAAAEAVGLQPRGTAVATTVDETSPDEAAAAFEDRQYAPLWDVDEQTWEATVVPRIRAMRALPDPSRPRRRAVGHTLWVWET